MTSHPYFSIVIPTYERPSLLSACLQSLTGLAYPRERFEVIVVDDGGQTSLESVIARYGQRLAVKLILQNNCGPAAARNLGARASKGQYLAFTDDDCRPAKNWLQALAFQFSKRPGQAIGGRIVNALPGNRYSQASQALSDIVYSYFNADIEKAEFCSTNNLAVPLKHFNALGGFNAGLRTCEDRDFCERWLRNGYALRYAPEVVVYHGHELNLGSFWRQHFRYGRGNFRYHQERIRQATGRFRLEPRFYWKILSYAFVENHSYSKTVMAALLLMTQAAKAAGFMCELAGQGRAKHGAPSPASSSGSYGLTGPSTTAIRSHADMPKEK